MSGMFEMIENHDRDGITEKIRKGNENLSVYMDSITVENGIGYCAVKIDHERYILAACEDVNAIELEGEAKDDHKLCKWDEENAERLRKVLPYTVPRACDKDKASFGTGDRLGLAGGGHVRCVKGRDVFPVLAQQSIRELTQTERSYRDVIDCASWAVFQEGYQEGFGADGDHLKTMEEIQMAVNAGASMITLDLSEKLRGEAFGLDKEALTKVFEDEFDEDEREAILCEYENQEFYIEVDGEKQPIKFVYKDVLKNVICYYKGIEFATEVYTYLQEACSEKIDFEISIDEVGFPTTPRSHYFVASELDKRRVEIDSMAPCFVGEFQKAIDYIGDKEKFSEHLKLHCAIAKKFGDYKISVHSGSDKFSVYPIIAEITQGRFHVKTAGTSWVEAVKLIALKRPVLYREIHKYALESFNEAAKLYHVTTDLENIPDVDGLDDDKLAELFDNNDARQLIHITYGFILRAKDSKGKPLFRDRLYEAWNAEEDAHYELLESHIGKHLSLLGK